MTGGERNHKSFQYCTWQSRQFFFHSSSSRSFRTQSHSSLITGQCIDSEQFLHIDLLWLPLVLDMAKKISHVLECLEKFFHKVGHFFLVFTADSSEIQFIVNHNSLSDGQKKVQRMWWTFEKKTIQTQSRGKVKIQKNVILFWSTQAKINLWRFDPIAESCHDEKWLTWRIKRTVEKSIHLHQQKTFTTWTKSFLSILLLQHSIWPKQRMAIFFSSPSSSSWWTSGWSWKWANNFVCSTLCQYSWFRLQWIKIHCNWRRMWTEHSHANFSHIEALVFWSSAFAWLKITQNVFAETCSPHVTTCLIVRCLSTHWFLLFFRVSVNLVHSFHLFHPAHLPCDRNRRVKNPYNFHNVLRSSRMRKGFEVKNNTNVVESFFNLYGL